MNTYCFNCMMPTEGKLPCSHCGYGGDMRAASHQLPAGTILNARYLIGNVIGQGGFGITYIGRDLRLDMRIAIKEYYPSGYANRNVLLSPDITIIDKQQMDFIEDGKKKFLNEARALAEFCDEAGIVDVRDYFEANQTAYIIMEYLDGQDLRKYLKHSLFTANQIFNLMEPVMTALEKIHLKNVIHRDISPDNIMMLKNGKMVLMDFGAARFVDYSDQKSVSVILKSGYAPEEQYRAKGIQGPWTDIYALCATIYKCITGITPDDSLQRGYQDEIKWPSELGFIITEQQESVLKKGLSIKQENRFQNISEMKQALEISDNMHDLEIDNVIDDVTVYKPRATTEEKMTEYRPREKDENPSDIHTGIKPENHDQKREKIHDEQKKNLTFVCIAIVVVFGVIFLVHLAGKKDQYTDLPHIPYERTMESDAVSLLKEHNITGTIQDFMILQEKENEKYQTYTAECEVTVISDGTSNMKTYNVILIYEVDNGKWNLSGISKIE